MPGPFRVPRRHGQVPGTAPYQPTSVNVGNTVSTTGSQTITGSVAVTTTTSTASTAAQVAVTTASTLLFATGSFGTFRQIVNTSTTSTVFLGPVAVTVTTGHALLASGVFDMSKNSSPLYGIVTTDTATVTTIAWA